MCLYPKLIDNPKYKPNKKNGGKPPFLADKRAAQVPIGCTKCMECRKQKAREWQVRLMEDIKEFKNGKFVTMTFSDESLKELQEDINPKYEGYDIDNAIATLAVRRFLERWRKKYGKSLRHWFTTELGQSNTERIHLHGIIWTDEPKATVLKHWQYGNMGWKTTWKQENNYVTSRSVNYIIKYISKADIKHPHYKSIILTSNGIGRHYTDSQKVIENTFKGEHTQDNYRLPTGSKTALPIYYRNKVYTETEREKLWLCKLDKNIRYICGEKINIKHGYKTYWELLEWYRDKNKRLGYGNDENNWEQAEYEKRIRNLKKEERRGKPAKEAGLGPAKGKKVGLRPTEQPR